MYHPNEVLRLIIDETVEIAIGETRNLVYRCKSNGICIIDSIMAIAEAASNTINSIKIDGVEIMQSSQAITTTVQSYHLQVRKLATQVSTAPALDFPMRDSIVFNITNSNAAANDIILKVWAKCWDDDEKEFKGNSSMTTMRCTTN